MADEREERWRTLHELESWLERPMAALGLLWLVLLVLELTRGLAPALEALGTAIWAVFVLDFLLRLALAPERRAYLARNWLTLISLAVPALRLARGLRVLRALRAARAVRGLRLVKVVGSLNRGMRALGQGMRRRHLGYVLLLTCLVTAAGAAGMYALERDAAAGDAGLRSYAEALWWTAMIMTTMGTDYWPRTVEGRMLCILLAVYAFAVFGYVTASLASVLIGRDAAARSPAESGGATEALREEVRALRAEVARWREEAREARATRETRPSRGSGGEA